MQWISYKEKVKEFSERIVAAQRPIRILNTVKMPSEIVQAFVKSGYKAVPEVTKDAFSAFSDFDLDSKAAEFAELRKDISRTLGKKDETGLLLIEMIEQYQDVLELIRMRGTQAFGQISRRLYGSPKDTFKSDHNTIFEMAKLLYSILSGIKNTLEVPDAVKSLSSTEAVEALKERFDHYFGDGVVEVMISDGVVADASAGGDRVKLRADARFSQRDVRMLEAHEGWVHVGTTMNGRAQPVAKWLSVGPPRCTSTQEGLAVLMEIFSFRTSVRRAQRINDRIISIAKAEEGANVVDIFEYFRTEGYEEDECLANTLRVFRGCPMSGGTAFTKDISYCRGFVENYNFMRAAIKANKPFLIPFLFAGKVHVDDIPLLYRLHKEGLVTPPKYLPAQFSDINGVAVWMSFSSFFNKVDLRRVQNHYNKMFRKHL